MRAGVLFSLAALPRAATALAHPLKTSFSPPFRRGGFSTALGGAVGVEQDGAQASDVAGRLSALRELLAARGVDALLVPSDDPHLSEYVAECFNRREFVSGFTGSAGTVVITQSQALLWTDGRYHLQAEQQLGEGWTLMKAGVPGTPEIADFLADTLETGASVGIDPFVHSATGAKALAARLDKAGVTLRSLDAPNVVDEVWGGCRPAPPQTPVRVHPLAVAGVDVTAKLDDVRAAMDEAGADVLVVAALDDVCYLLNLRGSDIACNPVVMAYVLVEREAATLLIEDGKLTDEVRGHLESHDVHVRSYSAALEALSELVAQGHRVMVDGNRVNHALAGVVPEEQLVERPSPVAAAKALKNEAEIAGMIAAHVRDGVAMARFLHWLSDRVRGGHAVSEVEVDEVVTSLRAAQPGFVDVSFPSIAGAGANGAIIHYRADPDSCSAVDDQSLFLLDSGAQYHDGTTDVTRTLHLGDPSPFEKECFTRVLQGNIALDSTTFPDGTPGFVLDVLARRSLWEAGLDYPHGTGHGVGAALNVHEGPQSISPRFANTQGLHAGMVVSNEPGFYKRGAFGIRIENLLLIQKKKPKYEAETEGKTWLGFSRLTKIPIQKSLVAVELMSATDLNWLDAYHNEVWEAVSPHLSDDEPAKAWLREATSPIERRPR